MSSGLQSRHSRATAGRGGVFERFPGEPRSEALMAGPYRIMGKLKSGGMSDVYEGVGADGASRAALKFVAPNNVTLDVARRCMEREAAALNRVKHQNVVSLLGEGEFLGRRYLALELIEGMSIEELARFRPFQWHEARPVLELLCSALDAVHSSGMVHGDLTARNVHLLMSGPRLMDFGFVKFTDPALDAGRLPGDGTFLGTLLYVAPEQVVWPLAENFDRRADIYSFGVLAHLMLSGTFPLDGPDASFCDILLRERPKPLREAMPGTDLRVERLVLKALEKDPDRRFQSAGELLDAIRSIH